MYHVTGNAGPFQNAGVAALLKRDDRGLFGNDNVCKHHVPHLFVCLERASAGAPHCRYPGGRGVSVCVWMCVWMCVLYEYAWMCACVCVRMWMCALRRVMIGGESQAVS